MPLQTESALRQNFETDGFLIHPEPVISTDLLQRAVAGMDAVRRGEFDTGESHAGVYGGDPMNPRVYR